VAVKRTSARRECSNSFKHLPPNAVPPPAATSGGVLASGLAAPRARRSGTVARGGATGGCGGPRPRRARLQRGSRGGVLACARGSRAPVAMSAAAGGKAQGGGRERQSGDSTPRPKMRRLQGAWWRRKKLGASAVICLFVLTRIQCGVTIWRATRAKVVNIY